MIPSIAIKN